MLVSISSGCVPCVKADAVQLEVAAITKFYYNRDKVLR